MIFRLALVVSALCPVSGKRTHSSSSQCRQNIPFTTAARTSAMCYKVSIRFIFGVQNYGGLLGELYLRLESFNMTEEKNSEILQFLVIRNGFLVLCRCVFTGRQRSCKPCTIAIVGKPSVCLSVCLSVTRWHWVKTTRARITKSSPTDSPRTLVFGIKNSSRNSKGFTPSEGTLVSGNIKIMRVFAGVPEKSYFKRQWGRASCARL